MVKCTCQNVNQVCLAPHNFSPTSPCPPCFVRNSIHKSDMPTSCPTPSDFSFSLQFTSCLFNRCLLSLCQTCSRHWGYSMEQDHQNLYPWGAPMHCGGNWTINISGTEWGNGEDRGGILNRVIRKGFFDAWSMNWVPKEVREWARRTSGDRVFPEREW